MNLSISIVIADPDGYPTIAKHTIERRVPLAGSIKRADWNGDTAAQAITDAVASAVADVLSQLATQRTLAEAADPAMAERWRERQGAPSIRLVSADDTIARAASSIGDAPIISTPNPED
jgi:hypothetical protein